MKTLARTIMIFIVTGMFVSVKANDVVVTNADSVNIMVEASLFFEAYKNKQYDLWTLDHGWKLIHAKPDAFSQFNPYDKMDKIMWSMYQDTTGKVDMPTKVALADTILHLYDLAMEYDAKDKGDYLIKRAYIYEVWRNEEPAKVIDAYLTAFNSGLSFKNEVYYKDRLGQIYISNATDENDYKIKALELYSKLSENEPDNAVWIAKIESLAENEDELVEIMKTSWDLDKENLEKAWKYASMCIKTQNFALAVEPLTFLVEKSPEVVNYWRELARAYDKLEETDKAINAYKKLIEIEFENKANYLNIALIYKKLDQLSIARTYLLKASKIDPEWDYPYYIEGLLYEQAARNCGFEFMDKCVYQLAVDKYRKAASVGGPYAEIAAERVNALKNSVPSAEDYFFRKMKAGDVIKIEGRCYDWINRSITIK